ncbi:MAG: metalloregulator ArsR/SmtB family transcription factor [Lapillicoccus sp.]
MRAGSGIDAEDPVPWTDLEVAAEIFRLLADPTRVGLVHALSHEDELSVSSLAERVGKRHPAVSQHLARLRMARLVTTRRQGTTVLYRLANEHVGQLVTDALHQAEHLGGDLPSHHL